MNQLFPLPLYSFLKIAAQNGISFQKLANITPWLLKTILLEPLRWAELALYNRTVSNHNLTHHPLFILGYYRSGTSYLHQCFTQDDRFGYHSNFQMVFPEIMLTTENTFLPLLEAICRLFKLVDSVHRVPLSFRFPGEEDTAMTASVDPRGAQWGFFFPGRMMEHFYKYTLFEGIKNSEIESWKMAFVSLIKKISLANHQKQLVLKSPPNTARIKMLLTLFPDAKFVFIHRNPYEVFASNKRFWQVIQTKFALNTVKPTDINSNILNTYSLMMSRYMQEKSLVPPGQLIELPYENFIQAPVAGIRQLYKSLQLADFSYCEEKITSFVTPQKKYVVIDHKLTFEEKRLVAEKWETFFLNWNYKL